MFFFKKEKGGQKVTKIMDFLLSSENIQLWIKSAGGCTLLLVSE